MVSNRRVLRSHRHAIRSKRSKPQKSTRYFKVLKRAYWKQMKVSYLIIMVTRHYSVIVKFSINKPRPNKSTLNPRHSSGSKKSWTQAETKMRRSVNMTMRTWQAARYKTQNNIYSNRNTLVRKEAQITNQSPSLISMSSLCHLWLTNTPVKNRPKMVSKRQLTNHLKNNLAILIPTKKILNFN